MQVPRSLYGESKERKDWSRNEGLKVCVVGRAIFKAVARWLFGILPFETTPRNQDQVAPRCTTNFRRFPIKEFRGCIRQGQLTRPRSLTVTVPFQDVGGSSLGNRREAQSGSKKVKEDPTLYLWRWIQEQTRLPHISEPRVNESNLHQGNDEEHRPVRSSKQKETRGLGLGINCPRTSCIGGRTLLECWDLCPPCDGDHSIVAGTWERLTGVALLQDGETSRSRNPRRCPWEGSSAPLTHLGVLFCCTA